MNGQGPKNVYESWALYDTALISKDPDLEKGYPEIATSYAALGARKQIPFFNVRNKAKAGEAYCNLDSDQHLSFVFHCYSVGIQFMAPVVGTAFEAAGAIVYDSVTSQLFAAEMIKHASFRLKVSQDEKLLNHVMLTPEGTGVSGFGLSGATPGYAGSQSYHNGDAEMSNRWKFAEPIVMPRNVILEGNLEFSEYGRKILQAMAGPQKLSTKPSALPADLTIDATSSIRVSLFGKREVQQRGDLHFT